MFSQFEDEQPTILENDPRLGREVILLPESQRRGYEVRGRLVQIERFANGDETWVALSGGSGCHTASFHYRLIDE